MTVCEECVELILHCEISCNSSKTTITTKLINYSQGSGGPDVAEGVHGGSLSPAGDAVRRHPEAFHKSLHDSVGFCQQVAPLQQQCRALSGRGAGVYRLVQQRVLCCKSKKYTTRIIWRSEMRESRMSTQSTINKLPNKHTRSTRHNVH